MYGNKNYCEEIIFWQEAEEYILAGSKFDPDATTRGQQKQKDDEAAAAEAAAKKPKMAKGVTMAATAKVCCYGITKICPCNNLRFFFLH